MIVTENPRPRRIPSMSYDGKLKYYASGKVTVGKFARLESDGLTAFYLPRIRGCNFAVNSRKFRHPGYKTADQAFTAGVVLLNELRGKI